MSNRKGVLVILDGLGDRPTPQLGGRTPLEAAHTPTMDGLVERGMCGMMDPLLPGVPVDTHTGTALLLGLPLERAARLARGPVEAAGLGLTLMPGDVAMRCNFAMLRPERDQLIIVDRRAGRLREDTEELARLLRNVDLGEGITADLHPASQHRAVLHLKGFGLSAEISDTDPGSQRTGVAVQTCRPLSTSPSAAATARAVNRFVRIAHERLAGCEITRERMAKGLRYANGIISRSAGKHEHLHTLLNHYGLRASVIAGEETVIGLARLFGFSCSRDPAFTAMPDTDLDAKVDALFAALAEHDFVALHIKAPDVLSHDMCPVEKCAILERIDAALGRLAERQDLVIGITGDHSTDSNEGRHIGDPVPALLVDPNGRLDRCACFGEQTCLDGGLGRIAATGFIASMLNAMGRLNTFGRMDAGLFFRGLGQ